MPLHIDHRPKDLKDVVGNRETVAALEAILGRKTDFPHALLFTGPSGCGKTTLARIVARRLGIVDRDLRELNIANTRGIDNAREIQEQMRLSPLGSGGARGWILDEVHQSTKDFQHAMLKTLEDTPAHVYFFLCTTDPQKLLPTVKTRCHEFRVSPLSTRELGELMGAVLQAENVDVPVEVTDRIARDAGGSARQALVVLDKVIDMEPAAMLAAAEQAAAEQTESIELCRALIRGERWPAVAKTIAGMGDFDVEGVRQHIMKYCETVLLKSTGDKDPAAARAWLVLDAFREPFDRNGRPGFVWAAHMVVEAK